MSALFQQIYPINHVGSATELPHLLGSMAWFSDIDYSSNAGGVRNNRYGRMFLAVWVANNGATTLLPSEIPSWDTTDEYIGRYVNGKAGADSVGAGVVSPFIPAAGAVQNAAFWLVIQGPTKVIQAGNAAVDAGDPLKTGASGRVDEQNVADTDEIPEVNARFGRALEDEATGVAGTKFRAMVDFRW